MHVLSNWSKTSVLLAALSIAAPGALLAQQEESRDIIVTGQPEVDMASMVIPENAPKGPEIKGIIGARSGNRLQVVMADGSNNIVGYNENTKIKSSQGLFSRAKLDSNSLLNGLPVTIKTVQLGEGLFASQISLRKGDLKTANMIKTGTAQGFAEQTAATTALRGRMGDIDQYNVKGTTNVNFDVGKANLTDQGKADLCATAAAADNMKNALLLVVGYTDSTGSEELNQRLSEQRASRVVNHLQQACGWKPYRMLTPTGMSEADPMASNDTVEGKAQNRRVAVNILVSKGLDGL
jgi:OmpA-OmpF porin, OOP family